MNKTLIRIGVSALLLVLLFTFITNAQQVWAQILRIDPTYVMIGIALVALDRFMMAYKWLLLLASVNRGLPLLRGMMIYCTATLFGTVLPVTVGADVIRGVLATRTGIGGEHVVASIIVERMIGFLACMLLGMSSLVFLCWFDYLSDGYNPLALLGSLAFFGAALLAMLSLNRTTTRWVFGLLPQRVRRSPLAGKFNRVLDASAELGAARSTLAAFTGLTLVEQLLPVALTWSLARGLGIDVHPVWLFCALTVSLIIARLPISIDGLGIFESIFAGLLSLAGVRADQAVAIAFIARALQVIVCVPWWLAYVMRYGPVGGLGRPALNAVSNQEAARPHERQDAQEFKRPPDLRRETRVEG